MPAIKCSNGKWKWGENGACVYATKAAAESAHTSGQGKSNYLTGK